MWKSLVIATVIMAAFVVGIYAPVGSNNISQEQLAMCQNAAEYGAITTEQSVRNTVTALEAAQSALVLDTRGVDSALERLERGQNTLENDLESYYIAADECGINSQELEELEV